MSEKENELLGADAAAVDTARSAETADAASHVESATRDLRATVLELSRKGPIRFDNSNWLDVAINKLVRAVRAEFARQPIAANELRAIAAWIRTPGNINCEDARDECARVLENRARDLENVCNADVFKAGADV